MSELKVYGPGTRLCSWLGYYKDDAKDTEYGVGTVPHECANGGYAYDPVQRFTKGSAERNKKAAEMYYDLRRAGKDHEEAKADTLAAFPV